MSDAAMDAPKSEFAQGDAVRLVHGTSRVHTVSSVSNDGTVMLCMFIAGRYQLRGPFRSYDIEHADA